MRLVLLGDAESPHLVKWARVLAPRVEVWVVSSRGFSPSFDGLVPVERRLALDTRPKIEGRNAHVLRHVPRLAAWLCRVRPDWINAHYLTSHGTMAWLATRWLRAPGRLVGSAWGSDILVTPETSPAARELTRRVLGACRLTTSDSVHMADRMRALGAREVMCFPFGLEALPCASQRKDDRLFFANRALEAIYAPERVVALFAEVAAAWPGASLAVANDGSLRGAVEHQARSLGIGHRVTLLGRLDAEMQAEWYARARWFISLPHSDSVSVSVIEAMSHGCIPLLSDLHSNRELVRHMNNGLLLAANAPAPLADMVYLLARSGEIARQNREYVRRHAMFPQAIDRFLARLAELT